MTELYTHFVLFNYFTRTAISSSVSLNLDVTVDLTLDGETAASSSISGNTSSVSSRIELNINSSSESTVMRRPREVTADDTTLRRAESFGALIGGDDGRSDGLEEESFLTAYADVLSANDGRGRQRTR